MLERLEVRALLAFTGTVTGTVATWAGDATGNTLVIDQSGGLLRHNNQAGFNSAFDFDSVLAGDQTVPAALGSEFRVNIVSGAADSLTFGSASAGLDQLGGAKMTVVAIGADSGDTVTGRFSNNAVSAVYDGSTLSGTGNALLDISAALPVGGVSINFGSNNDSLVVTSTSTSSIPVSVNGGGGSDFVSIGGAGSAQAITSPVTIGNAGGSTGINIDNFLDPVARTTTVTSSQVSGLTPAPINYTSSQTSALTIRTGNVAGNVINVLSTGTTTNLIGNDLSDVRIGNAGSVQSILGTVNVSNPPSFTDLLIDDSTDATGRTINVSSSSVTGIAPAAINYVAFDLTRLRIEAGTGNDAFQINSVAGFSAIAYTFNGNDGDDTFNIDTGGFGPFSNTAFNGGAGNDQFNVNFPAGGTLSASSFAINGGAALPGGRDVVFLNTNAAGDGLRFVGLNYTGALGGVDVTGLGAAINSTDVEQLNYRGDAANDDQLTVLGRPVDDVISVTPISASQANVFLGGSPTVLIPPGTAATNNPGIAGGGTSPDLNIQGLSLFGLTVNGNGGDSAGDQLIVNGTTEDINGVSGAAAWAGNTFGSASTIRPAGQAFDTLTVDDSTIGIDNNFVGSLVRVSYFNIDRLDPLEPDVVVNSGEESSTNLPPGGVADDFQLTPSSSIRFQLNGGDPPPAGAPNGDRLTLFATVVNVWSDKVGPPNVTIQADGTLPFGTNSIESTSIYAGTVNFWGDNNTPGVDQQDYVRIVGTGYQAFNGSINGSSFIAFSGVSFLNVYGYGAPPIDPNSVSAVDTLELTPYADNTPQGWGVATSFDEGLPVDDGVPADLLILNGIANVSEDVVVRPSALQAGQVVVTQGLTNVPIAIINFVANTDLRFQNYNVAGQPDTDTLALLGSLAQQPGVSIDQNVILNVGAAGDAANPKIIVNNGAATPFYHVQDFGNFTSLTIDMGSGNDTMTIAGTAGSDTFTFTGTGPQSADINVSLLAVPPLLVHARSIDGITLGAGPGGDTVNLNGTGNADTFSLRDDFAKVNDGPAIFLAPGVTINALGNGGDDTVSFLATGTAYTLNTAANPFLAFGTTTVNMQGIRRFDILGTQAADALTVIGNAADNNFNIAPTGGGAGSLDTQLGGLTVSAHEFGTYVVNGGSGGQDVVKIDGTSGVDTVTSTATVVTINGLAVDVGTNVDRMELRTFAGADSITLSIGVPGLASFIDAGEDNDTVNLTAMTVGATVLGGAGNDTITGSTAADLLDGGDGNDSISGLGGNDTITGGAGNDSALGGTGSDQFYGGDGDDTFTWNPGDGSDLVEGEAGQNVLIFNGADGVNDTFTLSAAGTGGVGTGTRLRFDRQPGNVVIDASGIQQVNANAGSGSDTVTINNLADTEVKVVQVTLGALATPFTPDGVRDTITINGRQSANEIALTVQQVPGQAAGTTQVDVEGLAQHIFLGGTVAACPVTPTDDVLTINGGIGNDSIVAAQGVELKVGLTINGGDGNDYVRANGTINGGAGNDTLEGAGGDCPLVINGGAGNDQICGGDGNDSLLGNEGNDSIYGGLGNDSILGGTGNDFLAGNDGNDTVNGEAGNDTILGGAGNDSLDGGAGNDLMLGDADADCGSTIVYLIDAGQGNDTLNGGSGNDVLNGDLGNDVLNGNDGDDQLGPVSLFLGAGTPVVVVPGSPTAPFSNQIALFTDAGNDTMDGGAGNDTIRGDTGDDSLIGGTGDDSVFGDDGNDTITGNDGNDTLFGGNGNDLIAGNAGNDYANGDAGNDTITGDDGDDTLFGGAGNDSVQGNAGNDIVGGDAGDDTMQGNAGNDSMLGGAGNDLVNGNDGDDVILGEDGVDTLFGDAGNDTILGGNGTDLISGGVGNDLLLGENDADTITGDDGNDTIYGGAGNDSIQGNAGNDLVYGDDGDDSIEGGAGNDTLWGGAGNDTICGDDGDDILSGDEGDDVANGDAGDDAIYGGDGADQLWGSLGNDFIDAGAGNDSVVGGEGNDSILGGDGDDLLFGGDGDDTILGGFGNDAIYGGAGSDYLLGGTYDTANVLHAVRPPANPSDGDDLVDGGAGFDRVDGGNGNNLLDAGDDGIRETILGGRGNDYAFTHNNHDSYRDLAALDGGHNRVFKDPNGSITVPAIPDEVCDRTVFAAPTLPVLHGIVIQPGAVLQPSGTPPAPFPAPAISGGRSVKGKPVKVGPAPRGPRKAPAPKPVLLRRGR